MNTLNKRTALDLLLSIFNEAEGMPMPVGTLEDLTDGSSPSMWIVTGGGGILEEYVDGGGILEVPFELRLRHRDIDPSDRITAARCLEEAITAVCAASPLVSVVDHPSSPASSGGGYAVSRASLKLTTEAAPTPAAEAKNLRIFMSGSTGELKLASYSGIRLLKTGLFGFDFPDVSVSSRSDASGSRSYVEKRAITARNMEIGFDVWDDGLYRELKDKLVRMMNPRCDLELTTRYGSRHRRIEAHPSGAPEFYDKGAFHRVKLRLTSPEPYFTDGVLHSVSFPSTAPVMTFPLTSLKSVGAVCSVLGESTSGILRNPGDAACPVRVRVTAKGEVVCPTVALGDKHIKYLGTLHDGDVLEIHSGEGTRMITVNSVVDFNYDRGSRFFNLEVGDNELVIYAERGSQYLQSTFEFEPRYLGI